MSSDIEPHRPQTPVSLTADEREVYRKEIFDRARLVALHRTQEIAVALRMRQHVMSRDAVEGAVKADLTAVEAVKDPRVREFMENFVNASLGDLVADVRGYQHTAALKSDRILAEEYQEAEQLPERPPTFLETFFGRSSA